MQKCQFFDKIGTVSTSEREEGAFIMKIGIVKEILNNENRVSLTPSGVQILVNAGHAVIVESHAGEGSGFTNEEYEAVGAQIGSTKEAWGQEMVVKVKEPQESEFAYLREDQIVFTYLHLASNARLTEQLVEKKVTGLAYETVQLDDQSLPLLTPMSEVAGYMATQIGAQFLEKTKGGKGVLLSGITGVERGKVTIVGGGVVGTNAAKRAIGMGADVTIFDLNPVRLKQLDEYFGHEANVLMSNPMAIEESVKEADLVIGSVLIPGRKAPVLVSEEMVESMEEGSVLVDVAIDQGGNFATSDRVTTHDDPIFTKHGVIHYTVSNMPGAVPRTSTIGLTNATVPYVLQVANEGLTKAVKNNQALYKGVNTYQGHVTNEGVAQSLDLPYVSLQACLKDK